MTYYLPIIISAIIIFTALMWWMLSLGNIKGGATPPTEVSPPKGVPAPPVAATPPPAAPKAAPAAKLMDDPKPASKTAPAKTQAPLKAAATKAAPAIAVKPASKAESPKIAAPKAVATKVTAPKPAATPAVKPKADPVPKAKQAAKIAVAPTVAVKPNAAPKPKAVAKPVIPDNLELLKGVGPKLNGLLKSMGITSFDQVANWTATDIAEVDAKLGTFAGRIRRDNWTDQAKLLLVGDVAGFEKKYGALGIEITKG